MSLTFDLISDLDVSQWSTEPDWQNLPTSLFCVVVGNVDQDLATTSAFLRKLSDVYHAVFYIDGPVDHQHTLNDLSHSYQLLDASIGKIPGVTHLQNNVVVINGVALIGTNGWHDFGFNPELEREHARMRYQSLLSLDETAIEQIEDFAGNDRRYLAHSIRKLQTYYDIKKIVVVTSAVPEWTLVQHDAVLVSDTSRLYGNNMLDDALDCDLLDKVSTWCFGNYAGTIDRLHRGIRFVNNCRSDGTGRFRSVYYPLRVVVET